MRPGLFRGECNTGPVGRHSGFISTLGLHTHWRSRSLICPCKCGMKRRVECNGDAINRPALALTLNLLNGSMKLTTKLQLYIETSSPTRILQSMGRRHPTSTSPRISRPSLPFSTGNSGYDMIRTEQFFLLDHTLRMTCCSSALEKGKTDRLSCCHTLDRVDGKC